MAQISLLWDCEKADPQVIMQFWLLWRKQDIRPVPKICIFLTCSEFWRSKLLEGNKLQHFPHLKAPTGKSGHPCTVLSTVQGLLYHSVQAFDKNTQLGHFYCKWICVYGCVLIWSKEANGGLTTNWFLLHLAWSSSASLKMLLQKSFSGM